MSETRLKIYRGLEKLLKNKSLANIKVIELCEISNVPRSTFYSNFRDIYSVPQWLWDHLMGETLYQIGNNMSWDEGHRHMFLQLLKHKAFFTEVYWEHDNNSILEYGYRGGYNAIKDNITKRTNHEWTELELVRFDYTIKALASLTTKWGRDGMVVPVDTIVQIFSDHVPDFLKELVNR